MEIIKLFGGSLAYALGFGLMLGYFIHYINLIFLKLYKKKIWHSMIGCWLVIAIIDFFIPKALDSSAFTVICQVIIVWGIIAVYKYFKQRK
jgi:hypothetical protein